MANKNTKRSNRLARRHRAAKRWAKFLWDNAEKHKNTIRKAVK